MRKSAQRTPRGSAVSVFVVDDHAVFCEAVLAALREDPEIRVLGYETDPARAAARLLELRPDVVLLDLRMPARDGTSVLRETKPRLPSTHFMMLAEKVGPAQAAELLCSGASGIVLKRSSVDVVLEAVKAVAQGEMWLDQSSMAAVVRDLAAPQPAAALTARQKQIVQSVAEGLSNKEIAARLFISPDTVKSHMKVIFHKLRLSSRVDLARWALEQGFREK